MNKSILHLFLIILSAFSASAQITIVNTDLYAPDDTINIVKSNNPQSLSIKSPGNQNWDFRSLKADSVQEVRIRFKKANDPVDQKFTKATMVLERPGEGNAYLYLTTDSLAVDGVADFQFDPSIKANVDFDPDLVLMKLPINYQDTFSTFSVIDSTIDTIISIGGIPAIDKIRVVAELKQTSECDAYGPLETVQTTFNTVRLRTVEVQTTTVYVHQIFSQAWAPYGTPTVTKSHRYTWLAKNRGYQVAEVLTDSLDTRVLNAQYLLTDSLYGYITDIKNPNCYGEANGEASFKTVVGSNFYSYKWGASSNNQQTSKATTLSAGQHIVTVTDLKTSETFIDTVILTEPDSIQLAVVHTKDEGHAGGDGEIEITANGGTPPYNYTWDKSSSTGAVARDLAGGLHTITVKDVNGCAKNITQTLGSTLSISEFGRIKNTYSIIPNPSNGRIQILGLEQAAEISVYDLTGKVILEFESISSGESISLNDLEQGIYLIGISSGSQTETHKLVIQ